MKENSARPVPEQWKYRDKMLNVKEAADYIHMNPKTLYQMKDKGLIRHFHPLGGGILFHIDDLNDWLDKAEIPARKVPV